jgi:hypothetical protein
LTDREGNPLAIEPLAAIRPIPQLFKVEKIKQLYRCAHVTVVGDKGMLKNIQLESLGKENYRYTTSISKPQIESLLKKGVFQCCQTPLTKSNRSDNRPTEQTAGNKER